MFIAVEGNMGVGKTTLVRELARHLDACFVEEPVTAPTFATLLERYYEDPERWGMTFQLDTLRSRVLAHRCAPPGVVLQDRSVIGDQIFARVARKLGYIDDTEYAVYQQLRDALMYDLEPIRLVLYLRTSPQTCLDRIALRDRSCEHGVPLSYLEALHSAHEQMAEENRDRCLILDWEEFIEPKTVAHVVANRLGYELKDAKQQQRKAPTPQAMLPRRSPFLMFSDSSAEPVQAHSS